MESLNRLVKQMEDAAAKMQTELSATKEAKAAVEQQLKTAKQEI